MRRLTYAVLALCALPVATAQADPPGSFRYPRVYGYTGRPYGPTQAHYQYQRQYGRAWDGYGGNSIPQSGWPDRVFRTRLAISGLCSAIGKIRSAGQFFPQVLELRRKQTDQLRAARDQQIFRIVLGRAARPIVAA